MFLWLYQEIRLHVYSYFSSSSLPLIASNLLGSKTSTIHPLVKSRMSYWESTIKKKHGLAFLNIYTFVYLYLLMLRNHLCTYHWSVLGYLYPQPHTPSAFLFLILSLNIKHPSYCYECIIDVIIIVTIDVII